MSEYRPQDDKNAVESVTPPSVAEFWRVAPTTYEQLSPTRFERHGTFIWSLLMLCISLIGISTEIIFGDTRFLVSSICLSAIGVGLPLVLKWMRDVLCQLEQQLITFVVLPPAQLREWSWRACRSISTGGRLKWACGFLNSSAGLATILSLGIPFKDKVEVAVTIVTITPLFFFCGTAAYNFLVCLTLPYSLAKLPIRVPLYQDRYTGVTSINWIISRLSLVALLFYSVLAAAILTGPYALPGLMLLWLSVLGVLVGVIFPVGLQGLHSAMRRAKADALIELARNLERAIRETVRNPTKENLEHIRSMFEFRDRLQNLPEWPIDLKTALTILTSILLPLMGMVIHLIRK